ncbi:MAG: 16S rRNA (guanine(527)-N(7))-methyltransferase RsmG [Gammaproteobacteria bacterium]|nr:16S rRNA (guanine(527)-N(7))-methyltransferase RsmG [Gammaproteobacteria bacterium]
MSIAPVPSVAAALGNYLEIVAKWNRAYNLTAVREPEEMISRHVLDSAVALPYLRGARMLDAGSGAGFPGIVLALLASDTTWVLVESNGKKARFLDHALRHLGLSDRMSVAGERLENYHSAPGFDTVTARALADLATLVRWTAPLLAPGGRLLALKGKAGQIEAERAGLGAEWRLEVTPVTVPGLEAERHIVCLERKN